MDRKLTCYRCIAWFVLLRLAVGEIGTSSVFDLGCASTNCEFQTKQIIWKFLSSHKIWWKILILSSSVNWILLGRFLAGFSAGGSFTLVPLYVAEISQDKIRGSLGSFFILSTNLGMLLIYISGSIFDYATTPKIMLLLPAIFILLIYFFPETPNYLLRNNKTEAAEASLKFLRGCSKRETIPDDVDLELKKMIRKVNNDAINHSGSGIELSECQLHSLRVNLNS